MNREIDYTNIFKDEKEISNTLKMIEEIYYDLLKLKGKINNKQTLEYFIKQYSTFSCLQEKIFCYYKFLSINYNDNKVYKDSFKKYAEKFETYETNIAFYKKEICNIENIENITLESEILKQNKHFILSILRQNAHSLTENEEFDLLKYKNEIKARQDEIEDKVDKTLGTINFEGKQIEIKTSDNLNKYLSSNDEEVSKQIQILLENYNKKHNAELSQKYLLQLNYELYESKLKKYNNSIEMFLNNDTEIENEALISLFQSLNENADVFQKIFELKKVLEDNYRITSDNAFYKVKIPFDKGLDLFLSSITILGEDYVNKTKEFLSHNTVDTTVRENKDVRDTSSEGYLFPSFASVYYDDTIYAVGALSHECGHCMNDTYSKKCSPLEYSADLLVTEQAAIVNQKLTYDEILNTLFGEDIVYGIFNYFDNFTNLIFKFSMTTDFFVQSHNMALTKKLDSNDLNELYNSILEKYYGNGNYKEIEKYDWVNLRIYYGLYNYFYVVGFLLSFLIVDRIKKDSEFKNKYVEFISSGSSVKPSDIYKILGVDICSKETYDEAFNIIKKELYVLENQLKKGISKKVL